MDSLYREVKPVIIASGLLSQDSPRNAIKVMFFDYVAKMIVTSSFSQVVVPGIVRRRLSCRQLLPKTLMRALSTLLVLFVQCNSVSLSFRPAKAFLRIPDVLTSEQSRIHRRVAIFSRLDDCRDDDEKISHSARRLFLVTTCGFGAAAMVPPIASAGEVGARITKAVTTSDLGISVRTSVVKGAQVMDQLDGKWEKFSDRFGLGAERSKAGSRPQPKIIPEPQPLQISIAQAVVDASDRVFLSVVAASGGTAKDLQERVQGVANKVRVSFERSGVAFRNVALPLQFETAPQFNFVVYSHFKAYSELLIERGIAFAPFRKQFERQLGDDLVSLILGSRKPKDLSGSIKTERLESALRSIDDFLTVWKDSGFVAITERTPIDGDQVSDWRDDIADLEFNIALDGDITLNSQVLLQEQGLRLYPSFCRYAVSALLNQVSPQDQKLSAMDYYFDTDYNSDPDKFDVKEVLLSFQLESL